MPEKIILDDGTEREVPTEDEMKEYQAAREQLGPISEQFETLKTELELMEGDNLTDKLKDLKERANPNWPQARTVIKNLKRNIKELGKEVDDEGNVIQGNTNLTPEQMQKIADETFEKRSASAKKAEVLGKFSKEDAESISAIYDRLQVIGGTFEENMQLAIDKIVPGGAKDAFREAITASGGGAPRVKIQTKGDVSEEGKKFGMEKFGLTEEDFNKLS
jgi:hypothetical protein